MNVDEHMNAVRRFGALLGEVEDLSQQEFVQALADRESLSEYIPKGQLGWDKPALLLRFMHEVCCIPLWQARECVIAAIEASRAYDVPGRLAGEAAAVIAEETGNVLVAEVTASLFHEASGKDSWWNDVLDFIRYGVPAYEVERPSASDTLH
jgi:hypothetical protein